MRPEGVLLPAPAISQGMRFGQGGEQLGDQKLISEPAVERLGKAVLPRRSWLDVGRGGAAVLAPAIESVGDEFGPVVAADARWGWVEAGELIQHCYHVFGLAAPAHPDGQAETSVLVDHIEELEPPTIGRGVELEVHGPDLVRVLGLATPHRAVSQACPLLLAGGGPLQPLLGQRRCSRLQFTVQPSSRSRRWAIRRPQRMCIAPQGALWSAAAISRRRCLSLVSSRSTTLPPWRWLLRRWTTTRQTIRSDDRYAPAGPRRPCACVPGSEVSRRTARCASRRNKILEDRLVQFSFCQKPFEAGVFLLLLSEPLGLFCLHAAVQLSPAVVGGLGDLRMWQSPATVLPWACKWPAVFSLRMI